MQNMDREIGNISDLDVNQRYVVPSLLSFMQFMVDCIVLDSRKLLEELCLIHEHGVVHGDLRCSNSFCKMGTILILLISLNEHNCAGRAACFGLREARRFLLLDTTHL
jgi:hypothetical protein